LGEGIEDWVYISKAYIKVVFIEVEKEKHVHCSKLQWKGGNGKLEKNEEPTNQAKLNFIFIKKNSISLYINV
jgi:hypothetical protein